MLKTLPIVTGKWMAAAVASIIAVSVGGYELWVSRNARIAAEQYAQALEFVTEGWINLAGDTMGLKDADWLIDHQNPARTAAGVISNTAEIAERAGSDRAAAALSYATAAAQFSAGDKAEALQSTVKAALQTGKAISTVKASQQVGEAVAKDAATAAGIAAGLEIIAAKDLLYKSGKLAEDLLEQTRYTKTQRDAAKALKKA